MSFTLEEEEIYKSFKLKKDIDGQTDEFKKGEDFGHTHEFETSVYVVKKEDFRNNIHLRNELNYFYDLAGMKRIILFFDNFRRLFKDKYHTYKIMDEVRSIIIAYTYEPTDTKLKIIEDLLNKVIITNLNHSFLRSYFFIFSMGHQDPKLQKAAKRFLINYKKYLPNYHKGRENKDSLAKAKIMYDYIMKDRDEFNWLLVPYTGELTENVKDEDLPPNVIRLD